MTIVTFRKVFFALIGLLTIASLGAVMVLGLPLSIDFTGGSIVEVNYTNERPTIEVVRERTTLAGFEDLSIRESGENGITIRSHTLSPEEHTTLLGALSDSGAAPLTEARFNSIGPSLGSELAIKAIYAVGAVIIAIVLYIAWAFRKVSRPVSSWIYGLVAILILIHDVIVPAGFYAVLSYFTGAQVDALFVVALLAILGYSVNDTIVIFDRVREHLKWNQEKFIKEPFEETVGKSITETLGRSINTSVTVALALLALVFVGSEATVNFALVLLVGVIAGTYSSILVAAPLLIPLAKKFATKEKES